MESIESGSANDKPLDKFSFGDDYGTVNRENIYTWAHLFWARRIYFIAIQNLSKRAFQKSLIAFFSSNSRVLLFDVHYVSGRTIT